MALELWSQRDLLEIRRDMKLTRPTDFWRKRFFGGSPHYSRNKEIAFGKIVGTRAMAPFALPSDMGKPIFKMGGASLETFTPAYIKLLDAVRPEDTVTVTPEEILEGVQLDMEARFDVRTAEISEQHLSAVYRTWDYMCAKAIIDGQVTVKYHPEQGQPSLTVTIGFGRDANHTVAFGGGIDWEDPAADIFEDVQGFIDTARMSPFGGNLTTMIVGSKVAPVFSKNASIIDKLDTQIRGGDGTSFVRGLQYYSEDANAPTYLGTLGGAGGAVEVYTYSDQQYDDQGNVVEMLEPEDIVMTAPGVDGLMAFGAVYDLEAMGNGNGAATDIFQKQYTIPNPSQLNMLTQSAPLPIPRNPNKTFKATVIDPT